jgi:hypothetical protein
MAFVLNRRVDVVIDPYTLPISETPHNFLKTLRFCRGGFHIRPGLYRHGNDFVKTFCVCMAFVLNRRVDVVIDPYTLPISETPHNFFENVAIL